MRCKLVGTLTIKEFLNVTTFWGISCSCRMVWTKTGRWCNCCPFCTQAWFDWGDIDSCSYATQWRLLLQSKMTWTIQTGYGMADKEIAVDWTNGHDDADLSLSKPAAAQSLMPHSWQRWCTFAWYTSATAKGIRHPQGLRTAIYAVKALQEIHWTRYHYRYCALCDSSLGCSSESFMSKEILVIIVSYRLSNG